MKADIPRFLLERFPERSVLSYEDFTRAGEEDRKWKEHTVAQHAYDGYMGNYDDAIKLEAHAFKIISRPWPEIDWLEIGTDGWMVPGFLNRKSFIHAFPSLLNHLHIMPWPNEGKKLSEEDIEKLDRDNGLLSADFIGSRLDLNELKRVEKEIYGEGTFDWVREFYASLDEEVKRAVADILKESTFFAIEAEGALNSYWRQWTE